LDGDGAADALQPPDEAVPDRLTLASIDVVETESPCSRLSATRQTRPGARA
jgi:hypothetical protein